MSRILIADDEPRVLSAFQELVAEQGYEIITAQRADRALELLDTVKPDLVILDIYMPGIDGLEAFQRIKAKHPKLPVIVITGQATTANAIEAARLGAFDYQLKPFDPADMLRTIEKALACVQLMEDVVSLDTEPRAPSGLALIGKSPGMQEVYKAIGRVARTEATVLIRGESGTGKELVAQAIYQYSGRKNKPLLAVNCVAIPETLLESELFGYERGAFTGANMRRIGKLEQARGGTILLDEIGDVPIGIQAKILRFLQERTFERIGGNETIRVDVRVLAATNRDLEAAIAERRFRDDLYHRLKVVSIYIPPLRQRREDIPLLTDYFIARFAKELESDTPRISQDALDVLRSHSWPGNVRELQHCLQRIMIFTQGYPIQAEDIRRALAQPTGLEMSCWPEKGAARLEELVRDHLQQGGGRAHEQFLDMTERLLLVEALKKSKGNQSLAAKLLGLPRATLHAKMQKHGLRGVGVPGATLDVPRR